MNKLLGHPVSARRAAFLSLLTSAIVSATFSSPAVAEQVAVFREPTTSWVILRRTINGPPTSRAFTAYQVSRSAKNQQTYKFMSIWFADCPGNTLAFAGASPLDDDLKAGPIAPRDERVISSDTRESLGMSKTAHFGNCDQQSLDAAHGRRNDGRTNASSALCRTRTFVVRAAQISADSVRVVATPE